VPGAGGAADLSLLAVLNPFTPAILFAVAITVSTWPAYRRLRARLGNHDAAASALACVAVALAVIVPAFVLLLSLGDATVWLAQIVDDWRASSGPVQLPPWLPKIPLLGVPVADWLREILSGETRMSELLSELAEPMRNAALAGGRAFSQALGQGLLTLVLLFFLYRDGDFLADRIGTLARRLGGDTALDLLATAQRTIVSVMISGIGTAFAQAVVAILGFSIAGVPNPVLLGAVTFVLSMAPVGPPLVWGGAVVWLLRQDHPGWAIFMGLYGFFGISLIDNFIKPYLISRSSHLPFALTFMGVIGGVLAFGIAGIFIGPTALALAIQLSEQRLLRSSADSEIAAESRSVDETA
jgi:predicted PurR-regulated permease PerM